MTEETWFTADEASFNSMIVRLKVRKGDGADSALKGFNSMIVRLKGKARVGLRDAIDVSIL